MRKDKRFKDSCWNVWSERLRCYGNLFERDSKRGIAIKVLPPPKYLSKEDYDNGVEQYLSKIDEVL